MERYFYTFCAVSIFGPAVLVCAISVSCGNGGGAPNAREPEELEAQKQSAVDVGRGDNSASDQTNPGEFVEGFEIVFDFAANLSQAHLRSGGLLIDFGTEARHKHTLGDWRSGWRGDFKIEETTFTYMSDGTARIFFDALPEEAGAGSIIFRGRAQGSNSAQVFLNGKSVGQVEFEAKSFSHASVDFGSGIAAGQNEIMLRSSLRKPAHDGKPAALAVDYVRVAASSESEESSASSYDAVRMTDSAGRPDRILLRQGESITYNVPIPAGGRLRGEAGSTNLGDRGRFEISLMQDDLQETVLTNIEIKDRPVLFDLPLAQFEGKPASITLRARSGEIALSRSGLAAPAAGVKAAPGRLKAKNLVVVLIDALRADRLALYDPSSRVRAEFLGRLGKESFVFERALAPENWTQPSVASLLTGLFPSTHLAKDGKVKLPETAVLASEHFGRLGFETAAFVANGYISDKFGFERGWDFWRNYVREGRPNRAAFVVDDVISWLKARDSNRPFFLYVHAIDPHVPYIAPEKYWSLYDSDPYNGPVQPKETAKLLDKIKSGAVKLTDRDKVRLEALYDGEVTYNDDHLSRLYDAMKEMGLLEDTLIVVTSDHGEEFFDHGSVGHGHSVYEELLRIPLIVRLPGAGEGEGAGSKEEVSTVDVLPTACEILGVEPPQGVEGRSLGPLLKGKARDRFPSVSFSEFLEGQRVARMGNLKAVYKGMSPELFDLGADPKESSNVGKERPVGLAALRDALGRHLGRFAALDEADLPSAGRKTHEQKNADIDEQLKRQLQELGYAVDK